jgi:hypothetical protein
MMKQLRQVCGFSYAMTFQRMCMDKALSTELTEEYHKWLRCACTQSPTPIMLSYEKALLYCTGHEISAS